MALVNGNLPTPYYQALETESPFDGVKSACPPSCGTPSMQPHSSSGATPVIRYSPDIVKKHIETVVLENKKESTFHGVDALKEAADQGILRKGQLIFGTVSLAHDQAIEGTTWQGWLYNHLTPFITKITTGQMRKFAYLHTAVYSGKYEDNHYVIENGGGDFSEGLDENSRGLGTIDVELLEDAFEKDAVFFVVSPPKDSRGKSTRYLVLQRALACIGLQYKYNMRAVSCETFATALLGLLDDKYFAPLQLEVVNGRKRKHSDIEEQKKRDKHKFEEFHKALCERIERVPPFTILTLKFYMNGLNRSMFQPNSTHPWFLKMKEDYSRFIEAAHSGDTKACLNLLKMGLNPEGREPNTSTAVMEAAREGHWETVAALVQEGADRTGIQTLLDNALNDAAAKGHTQICLDLLKLFLNPGGKFPHFISSALVAAVRAGHEETVSAMMKEGVDGGETLMVAVQQGNTRMVDLLLTLTPHTHQRDLRVSEALLQAAQHGNTSTAVTLINHNENIENKDTYGGTAHINAAQNGHTDTVKVLLSLKANIEHKSNNSHTALTNAAFYGHTSTVTELFRHNANIEYKDNLGFTALTCAAQNGHTATVDLLISHGANIENTTNAGATALTLAAQLGHTDTVNTLILHGANIHHRMNHGSTALIMAAQKGHTDTVNALLLYGANIHHRDNKGATALIMAAYSGHTDTVITILKHGANTNHRNNDGATALIIAADNGHTDTVITLLKHGANTNDRDNRGNTALSLALDEGHTDTVNILRSHETNAGIRSST